MPVISPVMPAPPKSPEKADPESDPESNPHSGQENPRLGIPARVSDDRPTVHKPWIVLRHVDYFGIGWFNDDGVALSRYLLLFIACQVAGVVSLLAQCLNSVRDSLLLIGVCVTER